MRSRQKKRKPSRKTSSLPPFSSKPNSPPELSFSVSEALQTCRSIEMANVGGFQCCLLDEPFNGVRSASGIHVGAAVKKLMRLGVSQVDYSSLLQGSRLQSFPHTAFLESTTFSQEYLAVSHNYNQQNSIFGSLAYTPKQRVKAPTPNMLPTSSQQGGGMDRNVRRGSKIVCGQSADAKVLCTVRVFLVGKTMLRKLKELVEPKAAKSPQVIPEKGTEANVHSGGSTRSGNASHAASLSNTVLPCKLEIRQDSAVNNEEDDDMSLPASFFLRLQKGLEAALLLRPSAKDVMDVNSDAGADDKGVWLASPSSIHHQELPMHFEPFEGLQNNEQLLAGKAEEGGDMAIANTSPPQSTHSPLVLYSTMCSSRAGSPLQDSLLIGIAEQKRTSYAIHPTDTVNIDDSNARNGFLPGDGCLPIMGINVIPLRMDNSEEMEKPSGSFPVSEKRLNKSAATSAAAPTATPPPPGHSVRSELPPRANPNPKCRRKIKQSSKSTRVTPSAEASSCRSPCGKAVNTLRGSTRAKKGTSSRVSHAGDGYHLYKGSHADVNTSEDCNLGMSLVTTSSVCRFEKSSPLFAIALSMPLVRQGSLKDVFQNWISTVKPSQLLRETAIRNIINAVLQHLVILHRTGQAHGSIKATNIFITSHVTEALDTINAHRTNCTDPSPPPLSLGKGVNTVGQCSGIFSDNTGVGPDDNDGGNHCCSRSSSGSSSSGFIGSHSADGAAGATAASSAGGGIHHQSIDMFHSMEWTKHIVLADGYYAQVEKTLMEAFMQSTDTAATASSIHPNCLPSKAAKEECPSSVGPDNVTSECAGTELDELHLFTLQEEEYIPPPECITSEEAPSDGSAVNTQNNPLQAESAKGHDNTGSSLPFRTTNNTRDPRCVLSPSHDIWMVAMLAIHLADGGCPWWMKRHHRPLPRLRLGSWSLRFASFVQRCACTDPAQRPSAEELLQDRWFHTALMEEPADVASSSPGRASLQHAPPAATSSSSSLLPLRRPCRRAFHDLMLEYHENLEEWCTQFSNAAENAATVNVGSFPDPTEGRRESFVTTVDATEPPPELEMTHRLEPECSGLLFSRNDSNNQNSSSSSGSSSKSSSHSSTCSGRFRVDHCHCRGGNSDYMSGSPSREHTESPGGFAAGTDSFAADDYSTVSHQTAPMFVGAVNLALNQCAKEATMDVSLKAEDAETETSSGVPSRIGSGGGATAAVTAGGGGGITGSNCSVSREGFPRHCDPVADVDFDAENENERLTEKVFQAFWNLHRECRLAADFWCMNLIKHMRLDGRTAELVLPLITEETMPFFTGADGDMQLVTLGRNNAMRIVPPTAAKTSQQEGLAVTAAGKSTSLLVPQHNAQLPSAPAPTVAPVADVSPTAFHNYMVCKWCVTTSWALQHDGRGGGNEGKR